jgi:hypothetical protein
MNRTKRNRSLKVLAAAVFVLAASACASDTTVYRNVGNIPDKPDPLTPEDERPVIQKSLEADRAKNSAAGAALEKEAAEQPPPPEAPPATSATGTGANSKATTP